MPTHYVIVLGITGKGKSSFINAMKGSYSAESAGTGDRCTTKISPHTINEGNDTIIFVDTPGLNDKLGDKEHLALLKKTATDTRYIFKCILIVMNLTDQRLEASHQKALIEFMNCFPLEDFWDHVIIIRTHADPGDKKFKYQKKQIEGLFLKSINEDYELNNAMREKEIRPPTKLAEYYIDSIDYEAENNHFINTNNFTKSARKEIIDKIKKSKGLFKNVRIGQKKTKIENGKEITYQEVIYTDFNGKKTTKEQTLETKPEKFKNKKIKYTTYETKRTGEVDKGCFSTDYEYGKHTKIIYEDGTVWVDPDPFETYWA